MPICVAVLFDLILPMDIARRALLSAQQKTNRPSPFFVTKRTIL